MICPKIFTFLSMIQHMCFIFILNKAACAHSSLLSCCFSCHLERKRLETVRFHIIYYIFQKNKTAPKKVWNAWTKLREVFPHSMKITEKLHLLHTFFFFNVHSSINDVTVKKRCDPSAVHTLCLLVQRSKLCTVHYWVIQTYTITCGETGNTSL